MARILALIAIEQDAPRATLEAMVQNIKAFSDEHGGRITLDAPVATPEVTIVGVVKDQHEPLAAFFTGEVA